MSERLTVEQRRAALEAIAAEIRACDKCPLHAAGRTNAVPGSGDYTAEIMFIGEGPGFNEDRQGLPFVGQSGKLLDELLSLIGMNRSQVFITNVVKCRPPENRDPLPDEVSTCTQAYLYRQIELIAPKVIVTLGRFSMGLFFPNAKITQIHGQAKWENGRAYLPLYHPAAVLRNMATLKPQMEADFRKIPQLLAEWASRQSATAPATPPPAEPPEQLSLF
ncbi:MAG: uracil-DNA glycosylase [Candidatus Thermofonsia Clade 1 bacterium]|jgi:DNA polymerase|uniref:Type-4 uracil-DNA glycosylase n=1 Tax=Candidatus Thermofonsia Clade 1 bacterium TaxID=2364210 RepID=A0A2M8NZ95_9CHLR|nr:MAG: uracil-DNA glycosylase [Candidatus Thermofonsia Clade 1 bacterium]